MKPWAVRFYKGKAWKDCREGYFLSQHGICQRCGGAGRIVHHVKEITPDNIHDPDVTLNWANLELCCQDCHNKEHRSGDLVTDGLMFDEDGDLVRRSPL